MKKDLIGLLFYPIRRLCERWWGKALRVCVFQLGEYGKFSLLRKIIQRYEKKPKMSVKQMHRFLKILEEIGGERKKRRTVDGKAIVEYMVFSHKKLEKVIQDKGGVWKCLHLKKIHNQYHIDSTGSLFYVVYRKEDDQDPKWKEFFDGSLGKMGWDKVPIVDEKGRQIEAYITHDGSLPFEETQCFLRCHSPGRSFPLEILYIGTHLGMKSDVCVFDYRGTFNSAGRPSEGGYYLDAEAIFDELLKMGYYPDQIWVTGFSLGGAVAAHIKHKYHYLGVNYIGENTFSSLEQLIKEQNWLVHFLGELGKEAILANEPEIEDLVTQDFFNTIKKLQDIDPQKAGGGGHIIIIQTLPDSIVPLNSHKFLYEAAKNMGEVTLLLHPKRESISEGHMDRALEDPLFWKTYLRALHKKHEKIERKKAL